MIIENMIINKAANICGANSLPRMEEVVKGFVELFALGIVVGL